MAYLDKLKFKFLDPVSTTIKLIEKWSPRKCTTEKDYENSLYKYLHAELPDIQVTKQYAVGRIRADLMVGDKVIIEIKKDLCTTAQYQRLVGQLTEYREWKGKVVLLLVGEIDPNLKKELESFVKKYAGGTFFDEGPRIIIFEK